MLLLRRRECGPPHRGGQAAATEWRATAQTEARRPSDAGPSVPSPCAGVGVRAGPRGAGRLAILVVLEVRLLDGADAVQVLESACRRFPPVLRRLFTRRVVHWHREAQANPCSAAGPRCR